MDLVKEPCQERRGLDYVVVMFYGATPQRQQKIFDACLAICEAVAEGWAFQERGASPHFQRVFTNDLGARIELTECDQLGARNVGGLCLSLPGTCWWVQTDIQAAMTLLAISKIEGFKHFTRLDFQNTELNPLFDAFWIEEQVELGNVWVKSATKHRPHLETDANGQPTGGITLYWHSVRSEKQGRTYDKAADGGWQTPAIRDEAQTRGRWAQAHGQALVLDLEKAHGSAEMVEAVHAHTASALLQHLDYWTLNGTSPKTDKNWKRKAQPADWYRERIGKRCIPIQKAPKPLVDLATTVDYGVQQYGRHMYRWIVETAKERDLPENFVAEALVNRFKARLRDDDMDWYLDGLTERQKRTALKQLDELRNDISRAQEQGWWA